ncbi:LacI family DNA-binding transcriptional regulator [Paludibacter jiangxiensis]|uniref:LacI family transcriptional regulator n=1 Tax=Paludibacter jiangxiensis TaxID=681398 RepID=A0A170ZGH8_9BACT|nr:LacI family DNA-binding transcriptional regulator [Paludibacter jiangxiensis]GAT62646.1 LacI family transcriptional regulator [Paludibacter jiangxiensis]
MSVDKKITIKDIAKKAGVSAGTVDRVLHNRGEVSEKSKEKIKATLKELNYEPNLIASSLSARKTYRIISLIPSFEEGDYWEAVDKGIDRAIAEFDKFNVEIEKRYFNQFEAQSFYGAIDALEHEDFQGLLLSPILRDKSLALCATMKKRGIPVVFVDSQIEGADYLAYFGQPSFQSGFIGAKFVTASLPQGKNIVLFRTLRKGFIGANQTLQRQEGFLSYLSEYRPDCSVVNVELQAGNFEMNELLMRRAFDERNNVGAAVIFNSTAYNIAAFLEREKIENVTLLGYDALSKNVAYLKQGKIAIIIAQRPEMQTYNGIKALFNSIVLKKEVKKVNYMPVDLLVKENADYYTDYKPF